MHDSVAAIRHGRQRTRFATYSASRRERQLGLRRSSRLLLAPASQQRQRIPPLLTLRAAARSLAGLPGRRGELAGMTGCLPRRSPMSWSSKPAAGQRISRGRSATPWCG